VDPTTYPAEQLYLILVLEFAGQDLEHAAIPNVAAAKSILAQLVYSLAVAERHVGFEHRDLHWGNVMIQQQQQEEAGEGETHGILTFTDPYWGARLRLDPGRYLVKMIDFTLARMRLPDDGGVANYCHLEDCLFDGMGEEQEAEGGDLQFDVYRWMRAETQGRWATFCPRTNVQWLYYLVDKLVTRKGIRSKDLGAFHHRLLAYVSAEEVLLKDVYFRGVLTLSAGKG
jgi:serine/threonine-protein kinase haspin